MNVSHMQWLFPLDKDVKLNIFPTTLNVMFKIPHIILPVFQRQYCWTEKQFRLYWKDLNDICLSYQNKKHHIGRFTLFEKENEVVVLDGQQRITTTLIIFIAIRDAFIRYNKKHNNSKINVIIHTIDAILYNNIKVNGKATKSKKKQNRNKYVDNKENEDEDEKIGTVNKLEISEGERLDFIRFLPTYLDRQPLYNLILNNGKYEEYVAGNEHNNNIYNAKRYFDARVTNIIAGKYDNHKLNQLKNLYNQLLTKFTFVYIGIPHKYWDKGFFIYQWLFEKSFLASTLIKNNRPGEHHMPCELFKNYILSFFMSFEMDKQEAIYIEWTEMEKAFPSQKDFNDYLIKTIGSKETGEYEIYQDFTKVIEGKLKDIDEAEYPLIVEKFLNELKQNISSLNANDEDSLQNNDENDIEQSNQINENDNDS
mmetsp:Transcript_18944/g.16842  ORF Transcript_18944/g.16842 Transcript_18944/m.16842 type:complete len:424 (-) Transcript_18944:56-1327(-)